MDYQTSVLKHTSVPPQLPRLLALLTCPVCYEPLSRPVTTACSHTFCSLCIRWTGLHQLLKVNSLHQAAPSVLSEQPATTSHIIRTTCTPCSLHHLHRPPVYHSVVSFHWHDVHHKNGFPGTAFCVCNCHPQEVSPVQAAVSQLFL